jgi:ABC-type Fe3+-hydroxamate transport system substrate-binding protein
LQERLGAKGTEKLGFAQIGDWRRIGWSAGSARRTPRISLTSRRKYRDLPALGSLTRSDTVNLEALLQSRPDLIVDFGSVRDTYISLAERVQGQNVLIDGRFKNTAAAVRLLGQVLGVEERAEQIATYVENTLARIDAVLAEVPHDQRLD